MDEREDMLHTLVEDCWDELGDAEKYACAALAHKGMDGDAADTFAGLAREEMGHYLRLHALAVGLVEAHPELRSVWSFEARRLAKAMTRVQAAVDCARK